MQLVTIKESHYLTDLLVLKSKLESEGIQCFLRDELSAQVFNHMATMTVKLQVMEKDLSRVKNFLEEI